MIRRVLNNLCCLLLIGILSFLVEKEGGGEAYAQSQKQTLRDSLLTELLQATEDTQKVQLLYHLSYHSHQSNHHDTALFFVQQALTIATNRGYKKWAARAYGWIGFIYNHQGQYPESIQNYLAAIEINEAIGQQDRLANNHRKIGYVYANQGDYEKALAHYDTALTLSKQTDNKDEMIATYNVIGIVRNNQGNYPEAIRYYLMAIQLNESIGDNNKLSSVYHNLANVYASQGEYEEALKHYQAAFLINETNGHENGMATNYNGMGMVYAQQGKYSEALKTYDYALQMEEKSRGVSGKAYNYLGIADVYVRMKQYAEALVHYHTARTISESIGHRRLMANCYAQIGEVYATLHQPEESQVWLEKGLAVSKEIGTKETIKTAYGSLATVYRALHQYKEAYESYKMYVIYKDSIYNEQNTRKQTQLEMQYEFDKKETALRYQHQLTATQLEKQQLLNQQQAQALTLRNKVLELTSKEKDLQHLAYLKEKAEKQDKEKQLQLSEKEKDLQTATLQKQEQEIAAQKAQRNLFIGGAGLMLLLAGSIFAGLRRTTKEKRKSESLLLNILPAEVAEELKEKGSTEARQFNEVSILFTDFVSFTQTAEKLSPQQLVQELNECFTAFDHIMEKHGLEKIKTIGDAYLAACGLPNANLQHARKTVEAALEIKDFMEKRSRRGKTFDIRIGIHTGSVVAGIVGVKKFAYDIWGDTVNTAARMESSGEAGKVNISETTYELVKDDFTCAYRGEIDAKGKGKVKMYFVTLS